MRTSANPVGCWAIVGALIITVLMLVYFATGGDGRTAFGMAITAWAVAAFLFLFYQRLNTVQRTGYMALIFLVVVAFMLPFFFLAQAKVTGDRSLAQYDNQLKYGASLYTTYCATCHGLLGQGIGAVALNNDLKYAPNTNPSLTQLTSTDINRIITAGVPDPAHLKQYLMPQWGQDYGGPLNADDINALTALVVSGSSVLRHKEGVPDNTNGFDFVPNYLTTPALQQSYQQQLAALKNPTGPTLDLTSMSTVIIPVIDTPTNPSSAYGFIYTDKDGKTYTSLKIKAGTTVIWDNKSSAIHSVSPGSPGNDQPSLFPADTQLVQGGTYKYTFTKPGTYPYYCIYHTSMVAQLIVVA
jgi:mono/diheme cytochrome c family protein